MDQIEIQPGSGDDTTSQRPGTSASVQKTATKPVTKPVTSARLSNLAKPKETPSSKPVTSSLNRPPSRLTSSVRKPVSNTTASSTTSATQKRSSVISIDSKTSGDEAKRDGLSARSKRLSMASSTSTAVPPTVKRTSTSTSLTSRTESKSPTATRTNVRSSATARAPVTKSVSKPAALQTRSTATQRPVSTLVDKKRLSTIQGSPAVRLAKAGASGGTGPTSESEREKLSKANTRPPLGTRKSTRSLLMEQQLQEFELVNQMLQAAMLTDGADAEEQEALEEQASETMSKLRSTLSKVRFFEKQYGRVPSEAELAEVSSVDIDVDRSLLDVNDSQFSASASVSGDHTLRDELAESRAYAAQLEYQIDDMTGKLKDFGEVIEAEGEKASEADDAFRTEHANKMREMSSANQARLDHLRTIHREELEELRTQHEQAMDEVRKTHQTLIAEKDEQLQTSKAQIEDLELMSNKNGENDSSAQAEDYSIRLAEALKEHDFALTDSKNQLEKLQAEIAVKEAELQKLRSLNEKNMEELEKERQMSVTALEALRSEHKKLLEDAESRLQIAQSEFEQLETASGKAENDTIITLSAQLTKAQEELASARSIHDQQVTEFQQKLDDTLAAHQVANTDHQSRLELAKMEAEDASERHENLKTDLEIQLGTVKTQLFDAENEMVRLKLDHSEVMTKLQKLQSDHEEKLNTLKESHSERLKHLEKDSKASLAALDDVEDATNARIAELQSRATTEKEAALQQQSEVHSDALQKLETEILRLQEQISITKKNHESELKTVTFKNASDKESALEALNQEHTRKIAELENRPPTISEDELQSLKESHAQELSQLDAENQNLMSQVSGSQFQLQTMKGILASTESESRAKEKEHAEALQQVEDQFSQAVLRISNHSHQLIVKDTEHVAALENARMQMQKHHDEALENLKTEHSSTLNELRNKLEIKATSVQDNLRTEHSKVLEILRSEAATKDTDIEKLKSVHSEALKQLQSTSKAMNEEAIENMKLEHGKQLDALRAELEASHQTALISAKTDFEAAMDKQTTDAKAHVNSLRLEHQDVISKLSANLETAKAAAADSTALDKAKSELANIQHVLNTTREEHDEVLKSVNASHQETVAQLEIEVADLMAAVDQAKSEIRPDLSTEVQKLRDENEEATRLNGTLQTDVSSLNKSQKSLEEQRTLLSDKIIRYEQQIKEAEEEINDLRKSATIPINTAASPTASTSSLKMRQEGSNGNAKSSPKIGLSSSRWADDGNSSEKENIPPASSPAGSGVSNGYYTERSKTTSSPRNVHSQLAGINEDIRSLHDLSEQMLEENRRMAKTLSRVDEETGLITMDKMTRGSE